MPVIWQQNSKEWGCHLWTHQNWKSAKLAI